MRVELNKELTVATFEILATPNAKKTKEAGRLICDEIEACRIRFAGNRQTVGVFPAHEVFKQGEDQYGILQPVTYAMEYNEAYLKFKNGEAQTMAGTPINVLPLVTPGKRLELKALNIHTVETLAALDGAPLKSLGMGGRDLKNQAIAYLEQASGLADTTQLNEELAKRDVLLAALQAKVDALEAGKPAPDAPAVRSPFEDYEEDDIRNWIKDADKSIQIDGRWGKNKLIEVADKINAKLAKAA